MHGEDRFRTVVADMADLGSVRAAASSIDATEPRLDVVIDNAGAIFPERTTSPDGYESTFATMVLGPVRARRRAAAAAATDRRRPRRSP